MDTIKLHREITQKLIDIEYEPFNCLSIPCRGDNFYDCRYCPFNALDYTNNNEPWYRD